MPDPIRVRPTSRTSAEVPDLVLREGETSRLIFRPMLVDNPNDARAAVKGGFIYQRKGKNAQWTDTQAINLNTLKGGEGVKLPLKSAEIYSLFKHLHELYRLYAADGIPARETSYLRITEELAQLVEIEEGELNAFFNAQQQLGSSVLLRLLRWASTTQSPEQFADALDQLEPDAVERLASVASLNRLNSALELWAAESKNGDEEFWQKRLREHAFVLHQIFSYPAVVLQEKAYVGGKAMTNKGGGVVDYLFRNSITKNIALLEIKTPITDLLRSEYRTGLPNVSTELTGAILQVTAYRDRLTKAYANLLLESEEDFEVFQPECIVLIGNAGLELTSQAKRRSFELFRAALIGVRVITFDELFAKVQSLAKALSTEAEA